jgi:t-SNARE complex subunit (syntaxin)
MAEVARIRLAVRNDDPSGLNPGGGGGTFDGMEARVARLESDMEHVKKVVDKIDTGVSDIKKALAEARLETTKATGDLKASLAAIDERTKPLPTKWDVFLILVSTLGALGVVATLTARFLQ